MMKLFKSYPGEILNLMSMVPWAFFPILSKLAFFHLPPLFTAAWTTFFATVFFIGLVTVQRKWGDLQQRSAWKDIAFGSLIIGVIFYGVVFWGLQYTSAGNAAIIGLLEIAFTFLFFGLWKKERHKKAHVFGAFLMMFGAMILLFPGTFHLYKGDLIILGAAMIPPLGNFYQQQARKKVSAGFVMLGRSFISTVFFFLLAFLLEPLPPSGSVQNGLLLLLMNGMIIFGISKVLYIESLIYLSVSRAIAMTAIAPVFTLFFAYLLLDEVPRMWQLIGLAPIITGTYFLTRSPTPSLSQK